MPTVTRTRTERPARVNGFVNKTLEFLSLKFEIAALTDRQKAVREDLMEYVEAHGETDEKGSYFLELPNPVEVHGQSFSALKRERRSTPIFLDDVAEALLEDKGLLDEAMTIPEPVPFLDQDKIYVLHQQGKLTEQDIDSMFEEQVTWAFKPLAS